MKRSDEQPSESAAPELASAAADERFESGAFAYAEYLRTVEGRLRLDIAWENFRAASAGAGDDSARAGAGGAHGEALDLGCGTGALSLRLARAGWTVCAADSSAAMIEIAGEAARREGYGERIEFHRVEAERAAQVFGPRRFSAVLCHNVLEYVASPASVARAVAQVLRPGGIVSLVARNRAGEAMRDAIKSCDLESAERALTADAARESLYGGPARLFDADSLRELAGGAGLEPVAARGVRVVSDYLPASLSESEELYARLLAFELKLGAHADFAPVARYVQLLARAPAV